MFPSFAAASADDNNNNDEITRLYQSLLATHQSTVASLNALETLHRSTALSLAARTYEVTCLHTEIATLKLRVDALNDDIRCADESAHVTHNAMAILKAEKAFITRQRNDAQTECRRLQLELSAAESGRAALSDATIAALNERIARMSESQHKMETHQSAIASSVRRIDDAQSAAASEAAQCMAKLDEAKALAARAMEPIKPYRKTNNKRKNEDTERSTPTLSATTDVTELANDVEATLNLTSPSTSANESAKAEETTPVETTTAVTQEEKEESVSLSTRPRRQRAARRKPIIEETSDNDSDYEERIPEKKTKESKKAKKTSRIRSISTDDTMDETGENSTAMSHENNNKNADVSSRPTRPLVTLNDVSNKAPSHSNKKAADKTKAKVDPVPVVAAPTKTKLFRGASSISAAVANAMNADQSTTTPTGRVSNFAKISLTMGLQSGNLPVTTNPAPPRPASSFVFNNPFKSFLTAAAAPLPPVLTATEPDNTDM